MDRSARGRRTTIKVLVVIFAASMMGVFFWAPDPVRSAPAEEAAAIPTPTPRRATRAPATSRRYSQFPHDIEAHKADCATCHKFPSENWKTVRKGDAAFPDITEYPKHESCINCHRQQFFKGAQPQICTICHTNPGPKNPARHPFYNPREVFDASPKGKSATTDFDIFFPHDKHVDIVSGEVRTPETFVNASWATKRRAAEESCAVCHQTVSPQGDSDMEYLTKPPANLGDGFWLKKGTFKSSPIGHQTCFTCHNADSGMSPAPNECAKCHTIKESFGEADYTPALATRMGATERVIRDAWSTRTSSGTFRHEFAAHADLACSTCHNVSTMITNKQATKKVAITSCSMCHAGDGGALNYEIEQKAKNAKFNCVKCHVSFGSREIPQSHIEAAKGN